MAVVITQANITTHALLCIWFRLVEPDKNRKFWYFLHILRNALSDHFIMSIIQMNIETATST